MGAKWTPEQRAAQSARMRAIAQAPARRGRQAAIMRERWAMDRDALMVAIQQAEHPTPRSGWHTYHAAQGHDGGLSAAIADGGHDRTYAVVRTLDYWEALHEPAWDIGWGDKPSEWCAPLPPPMHRRATDRCEQRTADGGWAVATRDVCVVCTERAREAREAEREVQRAQERAARAAREDHARQEAALRAAAAAEQARHVRHVNVTCRGCWQPLQGTVPGRGTYAITCTLCGHQMTLEVTY